LIASDPAAPVAAQAQARLMQTEAELKQAQAELTMQDAQLNAIRTQYNGEPVRKIGGGVTAPMPIYEVEPEYTPEARKAKFNGIVLVGLIVDTNGLPQNVHVLRGVGMGLDENAVAAVKQYKFKPAMEAGKSVPVEVNLEVNFKIF
jgi:TonB family protein